MVSSVKEFSYMATFSQSSLREATTSMWSHTAAFLVPLMVLSSMWKDCHGLIGKHDLFQMSQRITAAFTERAGL